MSAAERATGWTVPASLREWLCLSWPASLRGTCVSYPPTRGQVLAALGHVRRHGPEAGLLYIGGDGGDGSYLVRLGAGDDPPVLEENWPKFGDDEWHVVAPSFSAWLLFGLYPSLEHVAACSLDRDWVPAALDYLLDRLPHAFTMECQGTAYHHRYGGGRWVRVAPQWQDVRGPAAYWWVSARTPELLGGLLAELWGFGGFAAGLHGFGPEGGRVIRELRQTNS